MGSGAGSSNSSGSSVIGPPRLTWMYARRSRGGFLARHSFDRRLLEELQVVEPQRGQRPAPGATGVQADDVGLHMEAEGRPVAEDHETPGALAAGDGEPGDAPLGRILGRTAELRAH